MGRGGPDAYTKSRTWVDSFTGNRNVGKKTAFILFFNQMQSTASGHGMAHRKWKETKMQPGTAGPGNMLGCCLVIFHFLWAILCPQAVHICERVLDNDRRDSRGNKCHGQDVLHSRWQRVPGDRKAPLAEKWTLCGTFGGRENLCWRRDWRVWRNTGGCLGV